MSSLGYDMQWAEAMNDLLEQVKIEHIPREKNDQGVELANQWQNQEWFQHYACLYMKYIDIYRKLEECYDQIVHPQKRAFIKPILESTIARLCEMKKDLALFNARPKSNYVHLDDLLVDLKYDPMVLEIPVPRYFKEDDRLPVDIKFNEVEEEKKSKKKKKKKKKKASAEDKEKKPKPEPPTLDEKKQLLDNLLDQYVGTNQPEEEVVADPFMLDMDFVSAVRLIQKNERGRQYRLRILKFYNIKKQEAQKEELSKKLKENLQRDLTSDQQDNEAAVTIQKYLRAYLAKSRVENLRQEELVFLGMAPKPKTQEEKLNDPIKKYKETLARRKKTQQENKEEYENAKNEIKDIIRDTEKPDIEDDMLSKRRNWILGYRELHENKLPTGIKDFYVKEVETPLTAEEMEKKKQEEEEEAKAKKKKKDKKGEEKKKDKKKKKKEAEPEDPTKNLVWTGPSEIVQKFDEFYGNYNDKWASKDESDNFAQKYDADLAKQEVLPEVEEEIKKVVDQMIEIELENYRAMLDPKKKKKKKKSKKKKKKKGKKGKKLPGWKSVDKENPKQLLVQLVQNGIAKKLPPALVSDFIGEINYLGSVLEDPNEAPPNDPSMAQIRQLCTEFCIFPLGSSLVKKRSELIRSIIFYGPPGTGKTLMVRAIAHETASLVLDLSPRVIEGKYTEKKGEELMIASVFKVAKEFQPAVIYIDECEKVFPGKKKGKKKKGKKKKDGNAPSRIKKALVAYKKNFMKKDSRILVIGCSSEPYLGSPKDIKSYFDRSLYFPYPTYSTRRNMWREFIEQNSGILKPNFPLSTLSHISEGYTAGSIYQTCEKVLTKHRRKTLKNHPLVLTEFIGPLSLTHCTYANDYQEFRDFTDTITGDKLRREKLKAALEPPPEEDPKKKKKKKK